MYSIVSTPRDLSPLQLISLLPHLNLAIDVEGLVLGTLIALCQPLADLLLVCPTTATHRSAEAPSKAARAHSTTTWGNSTVPIHLL